MEVPDVPALRAALAPGRRLAVFGAGGCARTVRAWLDEGGLAPAVHLDNGATGDLDGVPVATPAAGLDPAPDAVLVASMYGREMAAQLRELGYHGPVLDVSAAHLARWRGHFGEAVQAAHAGPIDDARAQLADDASRVALDGLLAHRRTLDPLGLPAPTEQYVDARVPMEPGQVVVDAGGFDGDTAVAFAERVGAAGHVHAFEPVEENRAALRARLAEHPLGARVTAWPQALWHLEERLSVLTEEPHPMQFRVTPDPDGAFEGVRVDVWQAEQAVPRVDWIKMDIEGAEHEALAGAAGCLRRDRPRLAISAYHRPRDLWELVSTVRAHQPDAELFLAHHSQNLYETVVYSRPAAA